MRWDGNEMDKIFRLSKANIKRHKKESILLGVLIMLCAILAPSSIAALSGVKTIMPKMVEESGCYTNFVNIQQNIYADTFLAFLDYHPEVSDYAHTSAVEEIGEIRDQKGVTTMMLDSVCFISESGEKSFEKYKVWTNLSDEQREALEHPIYLEKSEIDKFGLEIGEEITYIFDKKEYPFTIAGAYESGLWLVGSKAIVSEKDLRMMEEHLNRYEVIGFTVTENADSDEIIKEFETFIEDISVNETKQAVAASSYSQITFNNMANMTNLSKIIIMMAGVIILAVIVMIRFRIVTDISEQMVSIGVLEAIGYKSKEIVLSYILEYMLVAVVGCIVAIVPSLFLEQYLLKNAAAFIHYGGRVDIPYFIMLFVMLGILLFVGFVAMTRALSVNKYPPVTAIRKGIATHHFKKTFLPLDKTRGNIHVILALKDFLQNTNKKVGFIVCIAVTTVMVLISFFLGTVFSSGEKVLKTICGHDLADISLSVVGGTDPESFAEELRNMPNVRKVLLSSSSIGVNVGDFEYPYQLEICQDYSQTDFIIATKGRLPKHENEIAITLEGQMNHLQLGQTVTIEYGKVKRDYIICGMVNSVIDPMTIYMTEDGFKTLNPLYIPDEYKIFLQKDADQDAFVKTLKERYGKEISDIKNQEVTGDTLEERIRSAAEIKMAKAMSESGVSYMEYAIRIGDEVITGSTSNMKIKSLNYEREMNKKVIDSISKIISMITAALMIVSAVVVVIILSILMSSTIREQYKELGIMKSLGYTSRELKLQMALKIIPQTVIGVVIGSILSVLLISLLETMLIKITVSVLSIVVLDFGILLFCFLCSYLNAKKIGDISVCELMTE